MNKTDSLFFICMIIYVTKICWKKVLVSNQCYLKQIFVMTYECLLANKKNTLFKKGVFTQITNT
ncbi:MAG TPA: hypothetical protein DEG69_02630 [Flavobacteriaceae bacterium]|nr:hypothetical protein [Flavobacteriaceae bacterium]